MEQQSEHYLMERPKKMLCPSTLSSKHYCQERNELVNLNLFCLEQQICTMTQVRDHLFVTQPTFVCR